MSRPKTLGVGVLGFGFMGRTHAFAHRAMPFFYDPPPMPTRLVSVFRANASLADIAKTVGGFDRVATSAEQLINDPDVDIVHICTPNHEHLPALKGAIAAQKHIYVDKPIVASLSEAEELESLLPGYHGLGQVCLQYRFFPATMRARQLMAAGFVGPVTHFRALYLHSGNVNPNRPVSWKTSAAGGGGVIRDLASHVIDLMTWLLGPFQRLNCVSRIWAAKRPSPQNAATLLDVDVEDAAVITVQLPDGAFGTLEASKIATGSEDEIRFEIHGLDGAIRFNLMQPNFLETYDARHPDGDFGGQRGWKQLACVQKYPSPGNKFPAPKNTLGWLRGHIHCLYSFLKCIAEAKPPEPSLADGIRLQRVLEAARSSAQTNAWVNL